jgi:hypothetical protein
MLTAYVTKPCLMDVVCGGIDRCDVFLLERPEFKPLTLNDPVFGEITNPDSLAAGHWEGEHHFKGKVLRKAGGEVLNYVWAQILNTYHDIDSLYDMIELHNKAKEKFNKLSRYPLPQYATPRHLALVEHDALNRFIHCEAEKENMRQHEWALPIKLELKFAEGTA